MADTVDINDVIDKLGREKRIEQLSEAMGVPEQYRDDLVQEVYLILLEYPEPDKIIGMYQRNELNFFIVRIIQNQAFSKYSPFFKVYRKEGLMSDELTSDVIENIGYSDGEDDE